MGKKREEMRKAPINVYNVGDVINQVVVPGYMGAGASSLERRPERRLLQLVRRIKRSRVAVREEAMYHLHLTCAELCVAEPRSSAAAEAFLAIVSELHPPGPNRADDVEEQGCVFARDVLKRFHAAPPGTTFREWLAAYLPLYGRYTGNNNPVSMLRDVLPDADEWFAVPRGASPPVVPGCPLSSRPCPLSHPLD